MRRSIAMLVLVLSLVTGCGPTFQSEHEELSYLKSLSNPTVQQWKRREELQRRETSEHARATLEVLKKEEGERKVRDETLRNEAEETLEWATRLDNFPREVVPAAVSQYRKVIKEWPNTPQAGTAERRLQQMGVSARSGDLTVRPRPSARPPRTAGAGR